MSRYMMISAYSQVWFWFCAYFHPLGCFGAVFCRVRLCSIDHEISHGSYRTGGARVGVVQNLQNLPGTVWRLYRNPLPQRSVSTRGNPLPARGRILSRFPRSIWYRVWRGSQNSLNCRVRVLPGKTRLQYSTYRTKYNLGICFRFVQDKPYFLSLTKWASFGRGGGNFPEIQKHR